MTIIKGLYGKNLKEHESIFNYSFNEGDCFVQDRGFNQVLCKIKYADDFNDFEHINEYNKKDIFDIKELKKVPKGTKIERNDFNE